MKYYTASAHAGQIYTITHNTYTLKGLFFFNDHDIWNYWNYRRESKAKSCICYTVINCSQYGKMCNVKYVKIDKLTSV